LQGKVGSDEVTLDNSSANASFDNATAGENKEVTVDNLALAGADGANYTLPQPIPIYADITPLGVTATFTAENRTYDGTVITNMTGYDITGVLGGDELTLTGTPTFDDPDVGFDKNVQLVGAALGGADVANYTLALPVDNTTANITKAETTTLVALTDNGSFCTIDVSVNGVDSPYPTGSVTVVVSNDNETWITIPDYIQILSNGEASMTYSYTGSGTFYFKVDYVCDNNNYLPSTGYSHIDVEPA